MLHTIDGSQPIKYPQLRKSSNTSRFQKNLRPRSHSRGENERSKSNISRNTMGRSGTNLGINLKNIAHLDDSVEQNYHMRSIL